MSRSVEAHFIQACKDLRPGVTPGFQLRAYHRGELVIDHEWGRTWKYYDLASLTKIMFTALIMMKAVEEKRLRLDSRVEEVLPWASLRRAQVQQLLSHSAGNSWWQPFYKNIDRSQNIEYRKNQLRQMLRAEKNLKPGGKAVYSDIDFFYLGYLMEQAFEKEWSVLGAELYEALSVEDVFFLPEGGPAPVRSLFAPTERCSVRGRVLQGEVHDENTWALGGVGPHAGLFGSIEGVGQWALALRRLYMGEGTFLKSATVKKFAARATPPRQGDWGLGFVIPTPGGSSSGRYFSPRSFGHTGFTGTSFWMDPERDLMVILLSNRIHPDRKNEEFRKWRPLLHDRVVEAIAATT